MKKCAKCCSEKASTEFHKNSRSKDGLCSYCKVCAKNAVDEWKANNPEKRAANQSNHYRKHKDKYAEKKRLAAKANPEKFREMHAKHAKKHRLKSYGLTQPSRLLKLQAQNNRCAMCGKEFTETRKPVTDHCHATGKTRDFLCSPCNTGLGHIEKTGFLDSAMKYLAKHKSA